jgi:EmrB/QacA subfamily drug resistance transporter
MSPDTARLRPPPMVFAGILVALSVTAISQTFVATALPTMVGDLGGFGGLAWIVGGYLLASTVVVPFAGKLADLYGTNRLFQISIVVFAIGSVAAGRSTNVGLLVAARVLQGLGGGAILTLSFTLVAQLVVPRERGRYQGYIASLFTAANVAGPLVGGFFVDHLSWRWIFYTTAAVCVVALLFVRRNLPRDARSSLAPFDLAGSCLLVTSLVGMMLIASWGGQSLSWTSPAMIALIVLTVAATIAFVRVEQTATEPVMPVDLFRRRSVRVTTILGFLTGVAMTVVLTYGPTFVQLALGVNATASGFVLMPLMLCVMLASTVGGRIMSRTARYRATAIAGALLLAVGTGAMVLMTSNTPLVVPSLCAGLIGLGIGLTTPAHMVAVQNAVGEDRLGAATSTTQFTRKIGSTIGVSVAGGLFAARTASRLRSEGALGDDEPLSALLETPSRIDALPDQLEAIVRESVASGAVAVFALTFVAAAASFVLSFRLPDERLADAIADAGSTSIGDPSVNRSSPPEST